MAKKKTFSFRRGWNQLTVDETREVRMKIMVALHLKHRTSFYYRLNGRCEPSVTEASTIEEIFAEHGIRKIWGE